MNSVTHLREQALATLSDALDGARKVALVNFPNHGNPGDPLIWLGTRQLLKDLGVEVAYMSAPWDFEVKAMRRGVGYGPVLLNGGGNFGDLYREQQRTRMRVLERVKKNPVIQMPQSIHFQDPANAAVVAEAIAAHPRFTMMVREHKSAAFAREHLGVEPVLSPDHALGVQTLKRTGTPEADVLWLTRRAGNPEHVDYFEPSPDLIKRVEWLDGVRDDEAHWDLRGRLALRVNRRAQAKWKSLGRSRRLVHSLVERTYDPLGERWVQRGVDMLSSGRVVVTDRLHGHLMCVLLDIPHVILDNSYGKVSGTLEAWTQDFPGVHVAKDGEQAWEMAQSLVQESKRS